MTLDPMPEIRQDDPATSVRGRSARQRSAGWPSPSLLVRRAGFPAALVAAAALFSTACFQGSVAKAERLEFAIVATYPHDVQAFTQGLLFHEGFLYESTGGYGESSLRKVELESGRVERILHLPNRFFGEGLALFEDRLYQLTWKEGVAFVYDRATFEKVDEFEYEGEGWGLTTDGTRLILSDGSPKLRFIDPRTFRVTGELTVRDAGVPVENLNELEYVGGRIFANIWQRDEIVCIDPDSGRVTARLVIASLQRPRPRHPDAVSNGIAYDPETGLLYLTGKRWSRLYAVRLLDEVP